MASRALSAWALSCWKIKNSPDILSIWPETAIVTTNIVRDCDWTLMMCERILLQSFFFVAAAALVTGQLADTPTRGLDKSRTGQLAVSQMPPKERKLSTQSCRWHPRVVQCASRPVRELAIRELSSNCCIQSVMNSVGCWVNIFSSANYVMLTSLDEHIWLQFSVAESCMAVWVLRLSEFIHTALSMAISWRHISQGTIATRLRRGGILNNHFAGNLSLSLKNFENRLRFDEVTAMSLVVYFFWNTV